MPLSHHLTGWKSQIAVKYFPITPKLDSLIPYSAKIDVIKFRDDLLHIGYDTWMYIKSQIYKKVPVSFETGHQTKLEII